MQREIGRLIFIDETSVKTNLTRQFGRAARGHRLHGDTPFGKWRTQTFIAGLKADGIVAPFVIEGALDGAAFDSYVKTQLAPAVEPGDIVILDNLNVHKSPRAAKALAERGAWFLFLPRYSPDLNPIKMAFAKLKAHLRAGAYRTINELWRAIGSICDLFTPTECTNCFIAAGYASEGTSGALARKAQTRGCIGA